MSENNFMELVLSFYLHVHPTHGQPVFSGLSCTHPHPQPPSYFVETEPPVEPRVHPIQLDWLDPWDPSVSPFLLLGLWEHGVTSEFLVWVLVLKLLAHLDNCDTPGPTHVVFPLGV